jgi:hypothetical protein
VRLKERASLRINLVNGSSEKNAGQRTRERAPFWC